MSVENNEETTERMLSSIYHGHGHDSNAAEVAFNGVAARPLPNTVEGLVERQLFDVLCGYCTGDRSVFDMDDTTKRSKRKVTLRVCMFTLMLLLRCRYCCRCCYCCF